MSNVPMFPPVPSNSGYGKITSNTAHCSNCGTGVKVFKSQASGTSYCSQCGRSITTSPEAETLSAMPAAKKVDELCSIVYCTSCGCNYIDGCKTHIDKR